MIFCCDLLPRGFNGPVCRDVDKAQLVCFLQGEKAHRSTFYDLIILTQWIRGSVFDEQCFPLLIPGSHFSFITPLPSAKHDNKHHNKSVNFPRSTRRQKQQPFLLMNYLVHLSEHQQTPRGATQTLTTILSQPSWV